MTQHCALAELDRRGFVDQITDREGLASLLRGAGTTFYVGFDPTASSLHVGHLLPIMAMAHLQRLGHRPIALVGGATGMVGDPSGRSEERGLLKEEELAQNVAAIRRQLESFLDFGEPNGAIVVDNASWIAPITHLEWLRDVGKHFTINYMIAKESVRRRLEDREHGVSYTEFSYMLLQAYDFLHLLDTYGCRLQAGGSDQWGNITAGIELVRKVRGAAVYGLTFPLVTTSTGEKLGKSAGNAIWLDPDRTSPYRFYQYWFNRSDDDIRVLLQRFSFIDPETIEEICREHRAQPGRREAQGILAAEVTRIVHGPHGLKSAQAASRVLFGGSMAGLNEAEIEDLFEDVPSSEIDRSEVAAGVSMIDLLVRAGLAGSKGEARRLVQGGGAYLNNERVGARQDLSGALEGRRVHLLRTGKRSYHLLRIRGVTE